MTPAQDQIGAIGNFLRDCGNPTSKLFLQWWERETFFGSEVQRVLLQRHPSRWRYASPDDHGYSVGAWRIGDQLSLGTRPGDPTEETAAVITASDGDWFTELQLEVRRARRRFQEWRRAPETMLERFIVWRDAYFMEETSLVHPIASPSKYDEALGCIFGRNALPADPTGAIRKAVHSENRRREAIMATWGGCWLTLLRGGHAPENPPAVKKKRVTKKRPNK